MGSIGHYGGDVDSTEHVLMLTRRKLAVQMAVMPEVVYQLGAEHAAGYFANDLFLHLQAYVYGEKLPPHTESRTQSVSVTAPASWWQHFKYQYAERWFMRPLARRRPARMQTTTATDTLTVTWEQMAAYPWMRLRTPPPDYLGQGVLIRWSTAELSRG